MALLVALALATVEVRAQEAPDAEDVRTAAAEFDAGARAYKDGRFKQAAPHFEAADEAVPSAQSLRMSIKARARAGHFDRAATLAALAKRRYPNDAKTNALAKKTIAETEAELHRLDVTCSSACLLALGSRSVPGEARKRWTVYLAPGDVTVSASFVDDSGDDRQQISARAGKSNALHFQPGVGPVAPPPLVPDGGSEPDDGDGPQTDPSTGLEPEPEPDDFEESSWISSPAVFIAGVVATVGVGSVLVWSGVDTLNNPGTDAVREACAGKGTDCPEYQEGLDKQLRTNILIGATAGVGALTVIVGLFVTDWGGDDGDDEEARAWRPQLTATAGPGGAALQLGGRF